jgi:hypothetical protein
VGMKISYAAIDIEVLNINDDNRRKSLKLMTNDIFKKTD